VGLGARSRSDDYVDAVHYAPHGPIGTYQARRLDFLCGSALQVFSRPGIWGLFTGKKEHPNGFKHTRFVPADRIR